MTEDKWQELIAGLELKGLIESREQVAVDARTSTERIIFKNPQGRMKLELTRHPKIVSTKTMFSKRIGAPVSVERVYSQTETVLTLKAFQWNSADDSWEVLDPQKME